MPLTFDQCVAALLGRGYFPKELPPPFQTSLFAQKAPAVRTSWSTLRASMSSRARSKHPLPSHPVLFDMARKGHARRTLAIPNPLNQFYLVDEIAKQWTPITNLIDGSALSITKCSIAPDGRAVPIPPLSSLAEKRIVQYATQGAILQTDVLSFYHAIYTHAIPWALHGKSAAKANRSSTDPAFFGNRIDELIRSCQDGQTIGIPVGPDTSRVISEVLLCAVENEISPKVKRRIANGFRYIDDFFLCFDSISDAESVLAGLREACLHFDLQLNAAKTSAFHALAFNEETWPSDITTMRISPNGANQRRSLMRYFSGVIRLSKELPSESIASFAVRNSTKVFIEEDNWQLYEAFILRMARENSNCIDSVVKIVCTYAAIGYPITGAVTTFIERIVFEHAPYNHHFEVAWALWLARSLAIRLSAAASTLVQRIENDVCALLALHLRSRRQMGGRSVLPWLGPITPEDLRTNHWLLIYEASLRKGWPITGAAAAVAGNNFFSALKDEGVSFYDSRAYNRPLNLPGINWKLRMVLGDRKRALLPGAVLAVKEAQDEEYESLGGDYGNDDSDFYRFYSEPDDDEVPL